MPEHPIEEPAGRQLQGPGKPGGERLVAEELGHCFDSSLLIGFGVIASAL